MREVRGALVAAFAAGSLAGCGLIPDLGGGPTTEPPPSPVASSPAETGGFDASCTDDGALQARASIQELDQTAPAQDGANLRVSLGWTSAGDGGDGAAAIYLQSTRGGATQARFEDLHVGDVVTHEDWVVTVRSVCEDRIGVDIALA